MKKLFTRSILTAGLGVALAAGTATAAPLTFTVDETVVPGTVVPPGEIFPADKLNGFYDETLTINGDFSFDANAVAQFEAYALNNGPTGSGLVGCGEGVNASCYGIYATFESSGTLNPGTGVFTPTSGDVWLYLDPSQDSTVTVAATGAGSPTIVDPNGDDILILSSSTLADGTGTIVPPVGGFFDLTFANLILTAFGQTYYPDLPLINLSSVVDGDFDAIPPNPAPGTYTVGGDLSAVFVPEPASMTLFGMTLLGAGLAARRRRSA
jgi:hypothetical protein